MNQSSAIINSPEQVEKRVNFHGASIIDDNGNEIPITESMVQQSLSQLIKDWEILKNPAKG